MDLNQVEKYLCEQHIYQYQFLDPQQIEFTQAVRNMCKKFCPNYRTSWSCPPAIIKPEKCAAECYSYSKAIFFSTAYIFEKDNEEKIRSDSVTKHETLTEQIREQFKKFGIESYILTSDKCHLCPKCSFPRDYCRFPEQMHPCIESHGIDLEKLLEICDMEGFSGENVVLLYTLLFIKDGKIKEEEPFEEEPEEEETEQGESTEVQAAQAQVTAAQTKEAEQEKAESLDE